MSVSTLARPAAVQIQQPPLAPDTTELKLEIFTDLNRLPLSHIVHAVRNDNSAPLIRRGEIVIADLGSAYIRGGWYPVDGGLFLIEYGGPPAAHERYGHRSWEVVQTFIGHRDRWYAGGLRRGIHGRQMICVDGPYRDDMALADKLIGKVIGLYRPSAAIGGAA